MVDAIGFGHRGQLEHRVRIDGAWLANFADPEALGVNYRISINDADSETWQSGSGHCFFDDPIEGGDGRLDAIFGEEWRNRHDGRLKGRLCGFFSAGRGDRQADDACGQQQSEDGSVMFL